MSVIGLAVLQNTSPLTARQQEVMPLVARGSSNEEIARMMGISLPTVTNHMHNIFERLQVHGRADALARLNGGPPPAPSPASSPSAGP